MSIEAVLRQGDCLDELQELDAESIDVAFIGLPKHGESVINPERLLRHLERVMKPASTIALLPPNLKGVAALVMAADSTRFDKIGYYVWHKPQGTGPLTVGYRPLKQDEIVVVLQDAPKKSVYHPQMTSGKPYGGYEAKEGQLLGGHYGNTHSRHRANPSGERYPTTTLSFPQNRKQRSAVKHRDGQPVELAESIIRTYSNPGDKVLDCCMGLGSTGVAALRNERAFVGIEKDRSYFELAQENLGRYDYVGRAHA